MHQEWLHLERIGELIKVSWKYTDRPQSNKTIVPLSKGKGGVESTVGKAPALYAVNLV